MHIKTSNIHRKTWVRRLESEEKLLKAKVHCKLIARHEVHGTGNGFCCRVVGLQILCRYIRGKEWMTTDLAVSERLQQDLYSSPGV